MTQAPTPPGSVPLDPLAARFRAFEVGDPLYRAVCDVVAARPDWLAMLWQAPPGQQQPNLWLAALHDRLLAGSDHPLRDYYPSVGGRRAPDAALAATLDHFVRAEAATLRASIRIRRTQTNEIGRSAVLWPALHAIARRHANPTLALFDLGCSAGLNLGVDGYRYRYLDSGDVDGSEGGARAQADPDPAVDVCADAIDPPTLTSRLLAAVPLPTPDPALRIVDRLGVDPVPVDVRDPVAVRWLRACLWPGDRARDRRLRQAVALARRAHWPVRAADDVAAAIEPWLDTLPPGALPVVFNSWVLHYVDAAAVERLVATMGGLMRRRGIVWLSAEGPHVRIAPHLPRVASGDSISTTLWIAGAAAGGVPRFELLARSHAHGQWLEWCAPQPG